jgi:hypothetical protein
MMRFLPALAMFALLGAATNARASCRWFGTQLECPLPSSQLLLGTQVAPEPSYVGGFRPLGLQGSADILNHRAAPKWPFAFELQNIGADPSLCRKFGNETYCY